MLIYYNFCKKQTRTSFFLVFQVFQRGGTSCVEFEKVKSYILFVDSWGL